MLDSPNGALESESPTVMDPVPALERATFKIGAGSLSFEDLLMEGGLWFRHDADAANDVRMIAMQARWDLQGVGAYWKFVELLRNNAGRIAKADIEAVMISMRWDHAPEWFSWCLGRGLFQEDKASVFSSRMLREIQEYDEYKAKRHEIAVKAGLASGSARSKLHVEHDVQHPVEHKRTTGLDRTIQDRTEQDTKDKYVAYGSHVRLTQDQYQSLCSELKGGEQALREWIAKVNDYCDSRGKRYKSHASTIRNWARKDKALVAKVDYGESGRV